MGKKIDRYELQRVIGSGAFATVWRAHDPVVGIDVALKVLSDNWARDVEMRERFLAEARLSLEIDSPRMVRVHIVNETDEDIPYIVMSLAEGGTLASRIDGKPEHHGRAETLAIMREVALALADVHRHGLIHRDIKPANILYQQDAGGERLILGDFGLARSMDKTALTLVSGSPAYMAPEQAAGLTQLDARADLYPLGIMFIELMTGEPPNRPGGLAGAAAEIRYDIPTLFAAADTPIDQGLAALIASLLEAKPAHRPQSAEAVVAAIDHLLGGARQPDTVPAPLSAGRTQLAEPPEAIPAERPTAPAPLEDPPGTGAGTRSNGRNLGLVLACLLVLGALVGAGALRFLTGDGPDDTPAASSSDDKIPAITATTVAVAAGPTATETIAVASPDGAVALSAEIPNPPGGRTDQLESVDGERRVVNVAGEVATVVDFYENLEDWTVVGREASEDGTVLVLTDGAVAAHLTLQPRGLTTNVDVTEIVMVGTQVPPDP